MSSFASALQASPKKRVPLADLKGLFFGANPHLANATNRDALLFQELADLAAQGALSLPAAASYERFGNPPLPLFATLSKPAPMPAVDYSREPWLPVMGFWPELKSNQLPVALRINEWLRGHPGPLMQVPLKERSLEIFGDEKRLDALRTGQALFGGRLQLKALGAFHVAPPVPYRTANSPGKPVLVVENHNTFWSFGEWNTRVKRYSAVAYGAGNGFSGAAEGLAVALRETGGTSVEYLGDLDPKGMRIPLDFNKAGAEFGLSVAPAHDFYAWLIAHGTQREKPDKPLQPDSSAHAWLGQVMGTLLDEIWQQGLWIPQEALGFHQLCTLEEFRST